MKAWCSLAFLRVWKARSVSRPIIAFFKDFNDISARFSRIMLMDSKWDPSMDTAVPTLRVHVGRPYFTPKFSFCHDFLFHDSRYDIRLTHLTTHSFIPPFGRAAAGSSAWSMTAPCDAHLLVRNDRSTHRISVQRYFSP